ncbi:MAG: hypothetical protein ACXWIN_04980 [Burkholderiaceae bacterium]
MNDLGSIQAPQSPRLDRRRFIIASCVAAVHSAFPTRVWALEPLTCLQAAAAVVGIVAAISGMASDTSLRKNTDQILSKLDLVIANQEAILADLRALRIYIDEALLISWRDAYARNIASYNEQVDIYIADLKTKKWNMDQRLRDDFEFLSRDAYNATLSIGQMDSWAFPSFGTGVAVILICDRILKSSPDRVTKTKEKFRACLDSWLNPNNLKSMPKEIEKTTTEISQRTATLNARSRTYLLRNDIVAVDNICTEKITDTLTISGTLEGGFSGAITTTRSDRRCTHTPICNLRNCPAVLDSTTAENELLIAKRRPEISLPADNVPIPVVPGFMPSGYAIVDDFNHERVGIYELMAINARQKQLAIEMDRMKKALI